MEIEKIFGLRRAKIILKNFAYQKLDEVSLIINISPIYTNKEQGYFLRLFSFEMKKLRIAMKLIVSMNSSRFFGKLIFAKAHIFSAIFYAVKSYAYI